MGFNKYYEVEINTQLSDSMFYSDDLIPHNTPFTLIYTVDNNLFTNLISIAGSILFITRNSIYHYQIKKSFYNSWYSKYYCSRGGRSKFVVVPWPISSVFQSKLKQFDSVLHPITAGTRDEFNVTFRKTRSVALAFCKKKANIKTITIDFSSGFYIGAGVTAGGVTSDTPSTVSIFEDIVYSNSPIFQLSNIWVEYAGTLYPFQPYSINFDRTNRSAGDNTTPYISENNQRVYYDYCNFSDQLRDRSGALLSQEQH